MQYYNLPTEVFWEESAVHKQADCFSQAGERALILTGRNSAVVSGALADIISALTNQGIPYSIYDKIQENPFISSCQEAGQQAIQKRADFIIAAGGGSILDAAKGTAVFAANPGISFDDVYMLAWKNPALPLFMVGTTAGTGSEVTSIAVLTDDRTGEKRSICRPDLYARVSFCDYNYTKTMSYQTTVSTALDALCHAIEGYFSNNRDANTDIYTFEAVHLLFVQLKRLRQNKNILASDNFRKAVHKASVLAGLTLNSCKTAFPHLIGYLLTEQFSVPHGYACAVFLEDYTAVSVYEKGALADTLAQQAGFSYPSLAALVKDLTQEYFEKRRITVPKSLLNSQIQRYEASKNRMRSPGQITAQDLVEFFISKFD